MQAFLSEPQRSPIDLWHCRDTLTDRYMCPHRLPPTASPHLVDLPNEAVKSDRAWQIELESVRSAICKAEGESLRGEASPSPCLPIGVPPSPGIWWLLQQQAGILQWVDGLPSIKQLVEPTQPVLRCLSCAKVPHQMKSFSSKQATVPAARQWAAADERDEAMKQQRGTGFVLRLRDCLKSQTSASVSTAESLDNSAGGAPGNTRPEQNNFEGNYMSWDLVLSLQLVEEIIWPI